MRIPTAPDDLRKGLRYRFDYESALGQQVVVYGRYLETTSSHGSLWFWFLVDEKEIPFDYSALNNLEEISE